LKGLPFGPNGIVVFILFVAFIAGFFLDWLEITLIILPLVAPVIKDLGFNLVWFVVIFAVCLQTSFLTPLATVGHGWILARDARKRNPPSLRYTALIPRNESGLAQSPGAPFRPAKDGERIYGTFKETVQLVSGKYALIENSQEFTLVPWRPVIDRQLGREVAGLVRGNDISWEFGRKRSLGISM
jgi:hypothetical protein